MKTIKHNLIKISFASMLAAILFIAGCKEKEYDKNTSGFFININSLDSIPANDTSTMRIEIVLPAGYNQPVELMTSNGVLLYKGKGGQRHIISSSELALTGEVYLRASKIVDSAVVLTLKTTDGIVAIRTVRFYKPVYGAGSYNDKFYNYTLSVTSDFLQSVTNSFVELTFKTDLLLRDSSITFRTDSGYFLNNTVHSDSLRIKPDALGICKVRLYPTDPQSVATAFVRVYLSNAPEYNIDTTVSFYSVPRLLNLNPPVITVSDTPILTDGVSYATIKFATTEKLAGNGVTFTSGDGKFLISDSKVLHTFLDNMGESSAFFLPDSGTAGNTVIKIEFDNTNYKNYFTILRVK